MKSLFKTAINGWLQGCDVVNSLFVCLFEIEKRDQSNVSIHTANNKNKQQHLNTHSTKMVNSYMSNDTDAQHDDDGRHTELSSM